jgi:hypothetical protein
VSVINAGLDYEAVLRRLAKLTGRLRLLGILIAFDTIGGIVAVLWVAVAASLSSGYSSREYGARLLLLPGAFVVASLAQIVLFDRFRRLGAGLFEEISDELQWRTKPTAHSEPEASDRRPGLLVRVLLRDFVAAEDLPVVPGRFGAAAYAAVNVLLIPLALTAVRL